MNNVVRKDVHSERVAKMRLMVGAKNDSALSRVLGVTRPVISKIKHGNLSVGAALIVSLHEETGMGTKEIKAILMLTGIK